MELWEKTAQLPLPGVYLYKDQRGEVIYVGKARNQLLLRRPTLDGFCIATVSRLMTKTSRLQSAVRPTWDAYVIDSPCSVGPYGCGSRM